MAISRTDFQNALREVVSSRFSHIPTSEDSINFEFSEKFIKRMERLIRSQKKAYWKFVNTASKRVAVLLVVLLTMITSALSVKAIREPVVSFLTEVYETFTRYFFGENTTDTLTKEYSINNLPNGFVQTDKIRNDISITTIFENDSGDIIEFYQTITKGTEFLLDAEHGNVVVYTIGNDKVHIMEASGAIQAIWIHDTYCLTLTTYGDLNIDAIKQMIESVE